MAQIHPVGEQLLDHRSFKRLAVPVGCMAKMAMAIQLDARGPHQKPVVTIM
jgi:hypothetical protein